MEETKCSKCGETDVKMELNVEQENGDELLRSYVCICPNCKHKWDYVKLYKLEFSYNGKF